MKRLIWPGLCLGRVVPVVLVLAGCLAAWQPARAGNFQIFPGRLVFDGRGGAQAITVVNSEQAPAVIKTGLVDLVMTPAGGLARMEAIGDQAELRDVAARVRSAKPLLTVAPQQMTVGPKGDRVVRVRAAPASLPPGEYRSHLTITSLPASDDGGQPVQPEGGYVAPELKFALTMTIPVIVRVGPRDARVELARPRLTSVDLPAAAPASAAPGEGAGAAKEKVSVLQLDLVRRGASSVYGMVEIRPVKARKKDPPLGLLMGTAVYPEVESRSIAVNLNRAPTSGERFLISFWDQEVPAKKPLAQIEFQAP